MINYYVLDGKQVKKAKDVHEWAEWFEDSFHSRRVASTELPSGLRISTVFLGLDQNYYDQGEPLLFETMVFNDSKEDLDCEICTTWEQAEAQHKAMVEKYK